MIRILFLLLLCTASIASDNRLRIVELQHSFADRIVVIIKPHLSATTGISASDNKLLLNISDEEFARIEPIIKQLDVAPIRLMISVRQRNNDDRDENTTTTNVIINNKKSEIAIAGRYQTERDESHSWQRVQTIDGAAAFLQTGYDIPTITAHYSPFSGAITVGSTYRAVGTGFYVLPRVNGNSVTLVINPTRQSALQNGQIANNVIETQVSGELGQWIALGSSGLQQFDHQTQNREAWHVELRADLMP